MNLYIDMGGTYLRYQIENENTIISKKRDIISFIRDTIKKYPNIKSIYISIAGQIRNNTIISAPNIDNLENLDLKLYFPNINFYIENDLNSAVLAEAKYFKSKDIVALYIGTGVGAGIISGGELIRGSLNFAGEIGHIPFKKAPFRCGCGKDNCIELFCGGGSIEKWANYLNQDFNSLDTLPKEIYNNFLEATLYGSSILISLFNPEILVLGGGVVKNNRFLVKYIEDNISKYAFNPSLESLKIVPSRLDNGVFFKPKYI